MDILAKMELGNDDDELGENSNEAEPSNVIVNCVQEFLLCIENKESNLGLSEKARKCYINFQTCSGAVMLIPDVVYWKIEILWRSLDLYGKNIVFEQILVINTSFKDRVL